MNNQQGQQGQGQKGNIQPGKQALGTDKDKNVKPSKDMSKDKSGKDGGCGSCG